jgi:hypothetical protein
MIKSTRNQGTTIPTKKLTEFNRNIFYDSSIPEENYTQLTNNAENYITSEEVTEILTKKFKANKSSGLSALPL